MKMYVAGKWQDSAKVITVVNPYSSETIGTVPGAGSEQVELCLASGVQGAKVMKKLSALERSTILGRTADLINKNSAELALLITREEGKTLTESKTEVMRAVETVRWSAEEAKRLFGETLPLDAAPGGAGKFGFVERVPCGLVVAISPFNFPLNLVCHKVGPALAAGNAVIIKPASSTPLTALRLTEILLEAGLPELGIQCITGNGGEIGNTLCSDSRVRKISFTGSFAVGTAISRVAGCKKLTMELGSNSPLIILEDADLELAATAAVVTGYGNAGQICISTQRIIVQSRVAAEFEELLKKKVMALNTGNPESSGVDVGPMISGVEADRVSSWVAEATGQGAASLIWGSKQSNAKNSPKSSLLHPEILTGVTSSMRVWRDELFGPVVCLTSAQTFEEALSMANDSRYGLSAAVFTRDIGRALASARELDAGNIHVNWGPGWRADLMPYGGMKDSGIGREGPRYAIKEMTELKTVIIH